MAQYCNDRTKLLFVPSKGDNNRIMRVPEILYKNQMRIKLNADTTLWSVDKGNEKYTIKRAPDNRTLTDNSFVMRFGLPKDDIFRVHPENDR